jgi:Domain of unknown function (DUF4159)
MVTRFPSVLQCFPSAKRPLNKPHTLANGVASGVKEDRRGAEGRVSVSGHSCELVFIRLFDDKGRLMVILCHNTDLGDGWEREVESEYYLREFSLKKAYPMGINIVVYALTH